MHKLCGAGKGSSSLQCILQFICIYELMHFLSAPERGLLLLLDGMRLQSLVSDAKRIPLALSMQSRLRFRLGCVMVLLTAALTFGSQFALQAVCCGQPDQSAFPQTMTPSIVHTCCLSAMQLARLQVKVNNLMPKHKTKLHLAL